MTKFLYEACGKLGFFEKPCSLLSQGWCVCSKPNVSISIQSSLDLFPSYSKGITGRSKRIPNNGGILNNSPDEGSEGGALRHATWSATLFSQHGAELATAATDCHERDIPFDANQYVFDTLAEADRNADYRNNLEGFSLGRKYPNRDLNFLLPQSLQHYNQNGLWQIEERNGKFHVVKKKLHQEKYQNYIDFLKKYPHW